LVTMYCVDPSVDEPIMLIDKHIGRDEEDGDGIIGDLFQRELLQLDGMNKKRIQVWINSPGGSVMDGYAIYSAILKSNTPVDTYCNGMAASIAGVIFQAGRKRYMADYGVLMYHNPFGGDTGVLEAMRDSIITMVSAKSGMDRSSTELMMNRETFLNADEAYKHGLADVIEQTAGLNTKWLRKTDNVRALWKDYSKVLNNILKNRKQMKSVTNKLKLNDEASEAAILSAIEEIQNKLEAAEVKNKASIEELEKAKNDMDEAVDKYNKMKEAFDAQKCELDEAKNKISQAEKAAAKAKAEATVHEYVRTGRIKNEAKLIESWVNKAIEDHDGTKALLESIPGNAKAVKFVVDKGEEKQPTYTAALEMAKIQAKLNGK
jgi:ATP-dependent Clp endopeptidase proteolytic subunit ClpP